MLSSKQINQYSEDGFTVKRGMISKNNISKLLGEINRIVDESNASNFDPDILEMEPDQESFGKLVRRIYDPCTKYKPFVDLSENDEVLNCIEQLIGPNLVFNQSKINMKLPRIGSEVEWHQDMAYGLLTNKKCLALLLYLDDADKTNGCLQVIPRQHYNRLLDHSLNGVFQGKVTENVEKNNAVAIEAEAGTVIFLHCMTPHSSLPNTSDKPRRTVIWGYRAADAYPVNIGDEGLVNVDRIVRGRKSHNAIFEDMDLRVPMYPKEGMSLYQIQEKSRNI
jgi:phytanoyl-CoA hydroxylase